MVRSGEGAEPSGRRTPSCRQTGGDQSLPLFSLEKFGKSGIFCYESGIEGELGPIGKVGAPKAGGITQKIGAYELAAKDGKIT